MSSLGCSAAWVLILEGHCLSYILSAFREDLIGQKPVISLCDWQNWDFSHFLSTCTQPHVDRSCIVKDKRMKSGHLRGHTVTKVKSASPSALNLGKKGEEWGVELVLHQIMIKSKQTNKTQHDVIVIWQFFHALDPVYLSTSSPLPHCKARQNMVGYFNPQ